MTTIDYYKDRYVSPRCIFGKGRDSSGLSLSGSPNILRTIEQAGVEQQSTTE